MESVCHVNIETDAHTSTAVPMKGFEDGDEGVTCAIWFSRRCSTGRRTVMS